LQRPLDGRLRRRSASNFSNLIGKSRTRCPAARQTAFAMAAAVPTLANSPMPLTPAAFT
jgi:hypothetical protein